MIRHEYFHRRILVRHSRPLLHGKRRIILSVWRKLVLHDQRPAAAYIVEQPRVVRHYIGPHLVRTDADNDRVVLRKIAARQLALRDDLKRKPHLPYRIRHALAAAADVANPGWRGFQIEDDG